MSERRRAHVASCNLVLQFLGLAWRTRRRRRVDGRAGRRTAGKDHLTRVDAVDHDWRLLVPAERIEVPGVDLTGGLVPAEGLPDDSPADRPS